MDVLVFGANGLLGSNLVACASAQGDNVVGAYHTDAPARDVESVQVDITDRKRVEAVLDETMPDLIVNAAAMTDVDGCEASPERAQDTNGNAPGHMAALAAERGIEFVHVSTDYVFDGRAESRYEESDPTNPIQVYGDSKLRGERAVREAHPTALVPRLSFVYGRYADTGDLDGFPSWVRSRLDAGETVPAFIDQHVTPTRAGQAAETILSLVRAEACGLVHVACQTCTTPYEIATIIAEVAGYDTEQVTQSRMADVDRPAPRPARTCLDTGRVERILGREQPPLREDLRAVL